MTDLRKEYKKDSFYWGKKHCQSLEEVTNRLKRGRALDIGAGEGRNSVFLALEGFDVLAIDNLPEAAEKIKRHARENDVSVETKIVDVTDFNFPQEQYQLVVALNVFSFLSLANFSKIAERIESSISIEGYLLISVFSTDDPSCDKLKSKGLEEVEKNTFYVPKREGHVHFFTKEEMKSAFSKLKIISLEKKLIEDSGHGSLHYHDVITLVATRENKK